MTDYTDEEIKAAERCAYAAGEMTAKKHAEVGRFSVEYTSMATIQDALRAYRAALPRQTVQDGRSAIIEECARAIDAVTVDWEADQAFAKRDAGEYLACHVRDLKRAAPPQQDKP